jgi:hypothetical protein
MQRQPTAHFQDFAGLKSGESGPGEHYQRLWCGKGEKTNLYDEAMKRFLVLDGISPMPGRSGLLAPARGYQSQMGRQITN